MLPLSPFFIFSFPFAVLHREGAFLPVKPELDRRAVLLPVSKDSLAPVPDPEGQLHFSLLKCILKEIKHTLVWKGREKSQNKGMEGDA